MHSDSALFSPLIIHFAPYKALGGKLPGLETIIAQIIKRSHAV